MGQVIHLVKNDHIASTGARYGVDVVADLGRSCLRGKTSFLLKPSLSCNHFPRKTAHLKCEFNRIETIKKKLYDFFYEYQQQNTDCFRVYACYSLTILFHYSYSDSYVFSYC